MIGNDVVDLQVAQQESNWQRPGFMEKIFTEEEQRFVSEAPDRHVAVWLLWSMKESAYKIIARRDKKRFFAPKKFRASVTGSMTLDSQYASGCVTFEGRTFFTKSTLTANYIHTIAQSDMRQQAFISNCIYVKENNYAIQHHTTQHRLFEKYAASVQVSVRGLEIQKDANKVPHLYCADKKQMVAVSTSHHGHYGGFVLQSIPKR